MSDGILFAGCLLVFGAFVTVLIYFRSGLFGLTMLNAFNVASATLPGFFFGTLFDQIPNSFTPEHFEVVTYSIFGLLAMASGVFLGWRPLKALGNPFARERVVTQTSPHLNEEVGWITFAVGMLAELSSGLVYGIPTLSTAVNCLTNLGRIGLLILLVNTFRTNRWDKFSVAILAYAVLSVLSSFASGHTFLRMNIIVPVVIVLVASSGFALRFMIPALVAGLSLVPLVIAWMNSRVIIRSGSLDGLPIFDKISVFFGAFLDNLSFPTTDSIMEVIMIRVDQTDHLAAQARFQPDFEPYAYGETVYSAFYTLIPRFIWNDKPVVAGGSEFFQRYTGEVRRVDDLTSIGIAYPFELYANGGPIFVIVGLALLGYLCARLELKLLKTPNSLGAFWALAVVTAQLCDGGQRTDVVLPAVVASALAAYALGTFIQKVRPVKGIVSEQSRARGNALASSNSS
jgi:hypothetical protein